MISSMLIVAVALVLAWIGFKLISFVASGCLKLVIFTVLAAAIAAMIFYRMKGF